MEQLESSSPLSKPPRKDKLVLKDAITQDELLSILKHPEWLRRPFILVANMLKLTKKAYNSTNQLHMFMGKANNLHGKDDSVRLATQGEGIKIPHKKKDIKTFISTTKKTSASTIISLLANAPDIVRRSILDTLRKYTPQNPMGLLIVYSFNINQKVNI